MSVGLQEQEGILDIQTALNLWNQCSAAEKDHDCIEGREEFTRCEVCEASTAAYHLLQDNVHSLLRIIEAQRDLVAYWREKAKR